MLKNEKKIAGSRFVVDFGNIKLSKEVEKRIDLEIRSVVLREVAKIDLEGDLSLRLPGKFQKPWPWWPGTMGIIIFNPKLPLDTGELPGSEK
ncbi:MAG: hypothetical protein AAB035_05120 [Nitrospirota bacterium]|jgi:hypothetical protein